MSSDPSLPIEKAFAARLFTPAVMAALENRYALAVNRDDTAMSAMTLACEAKGASILFISVTERITAQAIAVLLPELRVIATLSVGTDHIDMAAADAAGIVVITTPDVLSVACAELAWSLILGAARNGQQAGALIREGRWPGWAPTQLLGRGLAGQRLGILGMGRIGREVAARARGFEMQVHYHNRRRLEATLEGWATYHATPDALLRESDVLCLCAPGGGELDGFLDARRIALLPAQAIVINTGRGELINDDDLIDALENNRVFAAGLDVYRGEPDLDPRYLTLPNVYLSAHLGSATRETRDAMGFALIDGIRALDQRRTPEDAVAHVDG